MKTRRSNKAKIKLVLAGMLAAGMVGCSCERRVVVENDAYVENRGYYHASVGGFFPYPTNYFVVGRGYYYGGVWLSAPHHVTVYRSVPSVSTHVSITTGIPAPAPRPSQIIHNYNYNSVRPTVSTPRPSNSYSNPSTVTPSRPSPTRPSTPSSSSFSSGSRVGGFGGSAAGGSSSS